jgi:tellurite resistance protein
METIVLWRGVYAAAMLELDHSRLGNRIQEAQAVVQAALDKETASRGVSAEELQALRDAMHNLRTLHRVELNGVELSATSPTTTFSMQPEEATS